MKSKRVSCALVTIFAFGGVWACSETPTKSPDVADSIRKSLDQSGFKDVSVSQDRDKGVVTLTGKAASDADKLQAEAIAKSIAGPQVVADQIAVRPPGDESMANKVDSDLDSGIGKNMDAELVRHKLDSDVKYDVKNGVITLTGKVNSQGKRAWVEKMATAVPNVKQVVNELEVKNQKATSSGNSSD
jgi:hyperosmotically inducible periplasmic protein